MTAFLSLVPANPRDANESFNAAASLRDKGAAQGSWDVRTRDERSILILCGYVGRSVIFHVNRLSVHVGDLAGHVFWTGHVSVYLDKASRCSMFSLRTTTRLYTRFPPPSEPIQTEAHVRTRGILGRKSRSYRTARTLRPWTK